MGIMAFYLFVLIVAWIVSVLLVLTGKLIFAIDLVILTPLIYIVGLWVWDMWKSEREYAKKKSKA